MLEEAIDGHAARLRCRGRARIARPTARPPAHGRRRRMAAARPSSEEIADAIDGVRARRVTRQASRWRGGCSLGSAGTACRFGDAADGVDERAIEHARRAGDVRQERRARHGVRAAAISLGPTNVDEAIARCESCLEQTAGDRQSEGILLAVLGGPLRDAGRVRSRAGARRRGAVAARRAGARRRGGARRHRGVAGRDARRRLRRCGARAPQSLRRRSTRSARSTSSRPSRDCSRRRSSSAAPARGGAGRSCDRSRELATRRRHRDAGAVALRPRPEHSPDGGAFEQAEAHRPRSDRVARADGRDVDKFDAQLELGDVLVAAGRTDDARVRHTRRRAQSRRDEGRGRASSAASFADSRRSTPPPVGSGLSSEVHVPFDPDVDDDRPDLRLRIEVDQLDAVAAGRARRQAVIVTPLCETCVIL